MIDNLDVQTLNDHQLYLSAVICCQNPSLNPIQIMAAVERYLPQYKPDHAVCRRLELFDREKQIFR